MLEINKLFYQIRRKIAVVLLAGLVWFISLPATSVQAAGYYSGDYSTRTNTEKAAEKMGNYANVKPQIGGDNYIESGKRAAEVIPKDLGTGARQKNPGNMLQRAGEELGNDQLQRAFGSQDYDRSAIEKELARNKADRGDYNPVIQDVKRQTNQ
jgi:hypothetical protein